MNRFLACLALGASLASPANAAERIEQHQYRVHHALFGDIGTLTHVIRIEDDVTRVSTRAALRVQVLGVTLHHMTVSWDEDWQGDRLEEFRGTTIRNGSTTMVHAWAEGGHVTIATGEHTQQAPSGLQPINPWSPHLLAAAALMSPETGRIVAVPVADRGTEPIAVETGARASVHHYTMGANQLYFDAAGTLVKSEYSDITGAVTFTLIDRPDWKIAQATSTR